MQDPITIYTDGGCSPNPGRGGWAALLRYKGHKKLISGSFVRSTNNRMELMAVLQALGAIKKPGCHLKIYTDSKYIADAWNHRWIKKWQQNCWCLRSKEPVKNQDLWQELITAAKPHKIEFHWVKGHSGVEGNEIVDRAAVRARQDKKKQAAIDKVYELSVERATSSWL